MLTYKNKVEQIYRNYYMAIMELSKQIKDFGGKGSIHGTIVDIDFYNHAMLNPLDGVVTWYFAEDTENKIVYPSAAMLLEYSEMPPCLPDGSRIHLDSNEKKLGRDCGVYAPQKDIYRYSKFILELQYVYVEKIIRNWNEEILSYSENNKQTDESLSTNKNNARNRELTERTKNKF